MHSVVTCPRFISAEA